MASGDGFPRELLVLRHAKSSWTSDARTDFDRPLGKRGLRDAPRMGAWMEAEGLVPDLVVASPAERARRTALLAMEAMGLGEGALRLERGLYDADLGDCLRVLGGVPAAAGRVLLVGHNPSLEDLVLFLGGAAVEVPGDGKVMPTGALAVFRMPGSWGRLGEGAGRFVRLQRPRLLPG